MEQVDLDTETNTQFRCLAISHTVIIIHVCMMTGLNQNESFEWKKVSIKLFKDKNKHIKNFKTLRQRENKSRNLAVLS